MGVRRDVGRERGREVIQRVNCGKNPSAIVGSGLIISFIVRLQTTDSDF